MGYDVSSEVMISIDFQGQSAQMVMSSQTTLLFKSLESLWVEIGIEMFGQVNFSHGISQYNVSIHVQLCDPKLYTQGIVVYLFLTD